MKKTKTTKTKKQPNRQELLQKRKARRQKAAEPIAEMDPKRLRPSQGGKPSLWERWAQLWAYDVGIDLGTSNIVVYVKGKGLVLDEPSYVARYVRSQEIIAVGEDARRMEGRTPDDIEVLRPIRGGVIADYNTAEYLIRYVMHRVLGRKSMFKPRLLICIPSGITSVEKRAVLEASMQAGARKTVLIEEPLAAALGTGLDKAASSVAMVVDMGGGTTDIAVICQTGVVVSQSLRIGGDDFDRALVKYFKRRQRLLIGEDSAEALKKQIGTVDRQAPLQEAVVSGRDVMTGLPKSMPVDSRDMQRAYEGTAKSIVEGIKTILEKTPPEMIADIVDHGIILTGGGSLMQGFDRLLTRSTGIAAYLADNPLYSVALGTGRALQDMGSFQNGLEDM